MRARRREINIFNMSLLDILCGALGAFCFMMLVALPYYKPTHSAADLKEQQEKIERIMQQIDKLKDNLSNPGAAEDLEELLRQLRAQIKALEGQVNQLTAENDQLRAEKEQLTAQNNQLRQEKEQLTAENNQLRQENEQLRQENEQLKHENADLKKRAPFLVFVWTGGREEVELYLDRLGVKTPKGEGNPPFDPTKDRNPSFWNGDLHAWANSTAAWVVRDVVPDTRFKLYVKVPPTWVLLGSAEVNGLVMGADFPLIQLPKVTLNLTHSWILVGTLTCPEPDKITFAEATQAEREAEWKALTKATPTPSVTPTPTAAPSISPRSRREALEGLLEALKRRNAPESEIKNIEEVLEQVKREEGASATPSATRPAMPFDTETATPKPSPSLSPTP